MIKHLISSFPRERILRILNIVLEVSKIILAAILIVITSLHTYSKYKSHHSIIESNRQYIPIPPNDIRHVHGFSFLYNSTRGPITINKELDDGSKSNLYSFLIDTAPEKKEEEGEENVVNEENGEISFSEQRIAIVMYSDAVESNTLTEHAISEFYQYSNIHGYKFLLYHERYDKEREPFYMKLHSVIETIILGLKEEQFEWVMWVDDDAILANPNIKLQTFLPTDPNIHFIVAADIDGLNAGVFFIRVHPWSMNYLIQAASYPYYRTETYFQYTEEAALNNVLLEYNEKKHYVIVPNHWFNTYPEQRHPGDFILHFCYRKIPKIDSKKIREEVRKDSSYLSAKTNEALRKEVLEYYQSKRKHIKISLRKS